MKLNPFHFFSSEPSECRHHFHAGRCREGRGRWGGIQLGELRQRGDRQWGGVGRQGQGGADQAHGKDGHRSSAGEERAGPGYRQWHQHQEEQQRWGLHLQVSRSLYFTWQCLIASSTLYRVFAFLDEPWPWRLRPVIDSRWGRGKQLSKHER